MRHRWHARGGICVYCGMLRRQMSDGTIVRVAYHRLGSYWYRAPDCSYEWPEDWLPGLRYAYRVKPPAVQLSLSGVIRLAKSV